MKVIVLPCHCRSMHCIKNVGFLNGKWRIPVFSCVIDTFKRTPWVLHFTLEVFKACSPFSVQLSGVALRENCILRPTQGAVFLVQCVLTANLVTVLQDLTKMLTTFTRFHKRWAALLQVTERLKWVPVAVILVSFIISSSYSLTS